MFVGHGVSFHILFQSQQMITRTANFTNVLVSGEPKVRVRFRGSMTQSLALDPWTPWNKILKKPALENIKHLPLHPKKNIDDLLHDNGLQKTLDTMKTYIANLKESTIDWWNDKIAWLTGRQNSCPTCIDCRHRQREHASSKSHSSEEKTMHSTGYGQASKDLLDHLRDPNVQCNDEDEAAIDSLRKIHCWPFLETKEELAALKDFGRSNRLRPQDGEDDEKHPESDAKNVELAPDSADDVQPMEISGSGSDDEVHSGTDGEGQCDSDSRCVSDTGSGNGSEHEVHTESESEEGIQSDSESRSRSGNGNRSESGSDSSSGSSSESDSEGVVDPIMEQLQNRIAKEGLPLPVASPNAKNPMQAQNRPLIAAVSRNQSTATDSTVNNSLPMERHIELSRPASNADVAASGALDQLLIQENESGNESEPNQSERNFLRRESKINRNLARDDVDLMQDMLICTTTTKDAKKTKMKSLDPLRIGNVVAFATESDPNNREWYVAKLTKWDLDEAKLEDDEDTAQVQYLDPPQDKVKSDNSHKMWPVYFDTKKSEHVYMGFGNNNVLRNGYEPYTDWISKESIFWWCDPKKAMVGSRQNKAKTWPTYKLKQNLLKQINLRLAQLKEIQTQVQNPLEQPQICPVEAKSNAKSPNTRNMMAQIGQAADRRRKRKRKAGPDNGLQREKGRRRLNM